MVFAQYGNFFQCCLIYVIFNTRNSYESAGARRIKYMGMILNVLMLVIIPGTKQSSDVPVFIVYDL